jgi:hypothetical protein
MKGASIPGHGDVVVDGQARLGSGMLTRYGGVAKRDFPKLFSDPAHSRTTFHLHQDQTLRHSFIDWRHVISPFELCDSLPPSILSQPKYDTKQDRVDNHEEINPGYVQPVHYTQAILGPFVPALAYL